MENTPYYFRIAIAENEHLVKLMKILKEIIVEAVLEVDNTGIKIVCMDSANVCMVNYKLLSSYCVEYDIREPRKLGVNVEKLYNILKKVDKNDILILEQNNNEKLIITLKGTNTKKVSYNLLEIEKREEKIPELTFKAEVKVDSTQFKKELEFIKEYHSLKFRCYPDRLEMFCSDDELTDNTITLRGGENNKIKCESEVKSGYSVDYLMKFVEAKILSDDVVLRFSTDYPLSVLYRVVDKFELEFILSPRVENN